MAKFVGPFSWEDEEGYEKYTKTQTLKELQLVEEHMTKIHLQSKYSDIVSDGGLDPRNEYEKKFKQKPLTQDQMDVLCDVHLSYQEESPGLSGVYKLIRAVERAHGIGEKDE